MNRSNAKTRTAFTLVVVLIAGSLLAACETDGSSSPGPFASLSGPSKPTEPAKPPEPPMTRTRAASECWMKTEKGSAADNLDKRADVVNKCIDDKMKSVEAAPKT